MTIYLHPESANSLADEYISAFKIADEIFVLSAYLRDWRDFDISDNCTNATLIVGKDFGITRRSALIDALAWKEGNGNICHFYVADMIDGFHPKIAMWRRGNKRFLIVGSSNLTVAAFEKNYEANLRIAISEERYQQISNWIAGILAKSHPVTPSWIDDYNEAPSPKRAPVAPAPIVPELPSSLRLPKFPSLTRAIAERKERAHAFNDVRIKFQKAVSECASGKMSQNDFYDWLIKNWNGAPWKFQGNGIFRHKKETTDWRMLCNALNLCIESSSAMRDGVVQNIYDQLENSGKAAVRKSFLTEMLCHFFPSDYPLWNNPVEIWLKKTKFETDREGFRRVKNTFGWHDSFGTFCREILRTPLMISPN